MRTPTRPGARARAAASSALPAEQGVNLVELARGEDRLRCTWTEYQGRPFLSVRLWTPARDGSESYWPTKRGVSIRCHELREVRAALDAAIALAGDLEDAGTAR